jgi:mono/diheme cytochrome c family protein
LTFVRVMGFSLFILLVYTGFANILPQVQGDPPAEEEVDTGSLDMAGMVSLGEQLFSGKGTCTLCHNKRLRAPDLLALDLAKTFPQRLADARYTGVAKSKEGAQAIGEYIHESMLDPSKYVVAGFGKKGSGDTISQMPKIDSPPISLSAVEINAITAFLQDRAGLIPTIALPSADEAPATASEGGDEEEGPAITAIAALDKFSCSACHDLEGSEADIGPKLNGISKKLNDVKIAEAIIKPNAEITEGFEADIMPDDFGEQMRVSELNLIIEYLKNLPEQP